MVKLQNLVLQINYIVQIMVYLRVLQIKLVLIFILTIKVVMIMIILVVIICWENDFQFYIKMINFITFLSSFNLMNLVQDYVFQTYQISQLLVQYFTQLSSQLFIQQIIQLKLQTNSQMNFLQMFFLIIQWMIYQML